MQKQTCLKKVTKSGGKRLSHLLIDKADNAKDFSIRFKRMVGLKLLPSFSIKSHNLHFVSFWLYCPLLLFNNGSFSNNMLFLPRIYIKVVIIYINIRL